MPDAEIWDGQRALGPTVVQEADGLLKTLFPICRSLTGDGVRETLARLRRVSEFEIKEIPSGTVCYDWVVPDEWNIREAYVEDSAGNRIIDFKNNNLHVLNYSIPVNRTMSFQELESHLYTLPQLPSAIPYRISYYSRNWGICLSHDQLGRMEKNGRYHVVIDSVLKPGKLTYGECLILGSSRQQFLISTYCCHPSLANDNLSGQVLWALLLRELKSMKTYHSYRFVIAPETIGAIAYLHQNERAMKGVTGGFVLTTVAGPGRFGYKHTYLGGHLIDRVVHKTFSEAGIDYIPYPFDINGSDERQYSQPYFRIPIGTICKDKYYEYDYYHTSLDNLDFISAENLVETLRVYLAAIEKLEMNRVYRSLNPQCEPMLGKRGLYPGISGHVKQPATDPERSHLAQDYSVSGGKSIKGVDLDAMLTVMFYSDGETSLLDMSEKTGLPMKDLFHNAETLRGHGLLELVA
ncbi:MAG: DUF4910 domain-containing protein [Chloroflexi bacterium]|nr:DUF4910 domain-containing protein [Chloroflexota bacterium]